MNFQHIFLLSHFHKETDLFSHGSYLANVTIALEQEFVSCTILRLIKICIYNKTSGTGKLLVYSADSR